MRHPLVEPSSRTPGDRLKPRFESSYSPEATVRSWKEADVVSSGAVTHDEKGVATAVLPSLSAGAYVLPYETTDELGATVRWPEPVAGSMVRVTPPSRISQIAKSPFSATGIRRTACCAR